MTNTIETSSFIETENNECTTAVKMTREDL